MIRRNSGRELTLRFCLLILAASFAMQPQTVRAGTIAGRVIHGTIPVAGIEVAAYPSLDFSAPPLATAATDVEGLYRLELPPGLYALFARDEPRALFALCGRNPVAVAEDGVWAGLQAVHLSKTCSASYNDNYSGAVEGRVLHDGKPVAGARVYLYLDTEDNLKGRGYRLSPPTGVDGAFSFDGLPESDYFLVARKREGGGRVGPVREGDLFGVFPSNPLYVKAGRVVRLDLPLVTKIQEENASETFMHATGMALQGRVTDSAGKAVKGVHVFAYTDRVIGHQRPAALSAPTGDDGRFTVTFTEPGRYYVGAREEYGDSPMPGELFGMYEESADHSIRIEKGKPRDGIHLVVEPILLD